MEKRKRLGVMRVKQRHNGDAARCGSTAMKLLRYY
jgi:hypothetical protein